MNSQLDIKIQDLSCHVHNSYIEAVIGNEILKCQAPSNNAQKYAWRKPHK